MSAEPEADRAGAAHPVTRLTLELVAEASGREVRVDPVLPGTGGPAGNARLTAWTGLLLLVLGVIELFTLIDVRGLISWHVFVGALLVPVAVLKIATTSWRFARYYAAHRPYRTAGPPPTILRALGPLVIASTLAVLGSGIALILLGPQNSRVAIVTILGQRIDALTVHQASFAVWAVAVGIHLLARIVPALRLAGARIPGVAPAARTAGGVPGRRTRVVVLVATAVVAVLLAGLVLQATGGWRTDDRNRPPGPPPGAQSLVPADTQSLAPAA